MTLTYLNGMSLKQMSIDAKMTALQMQATIDYESLIKNNCKIFMGPNANISIITRQESKGLWHVIAVKTKINGNRTIALSGKDPNLRVAMSVAHEKSAREVDRFVSFQGTYHWTQPFSFDEDTEDLYTMLDKFEAQNGGGCGSKDDPTGARIWGTTAVTPDSDSSASEDDNNSEPGCEMSDWEDEGGEEGKKARRRDGKQTTFFPTITKKEGTKPFVPPRAAVTATPDYKLSPSAAVTLPPSAPIRPYNPVLEQYGPWPPVYMPPPPGFKAAAGTKTITPTTSNTVGKPYFPPADVMMGSSNTAYVARKRLDDKMLRHKQENANTFNYLRRKDGYPVEPISSTSTKTKIPPSPPSSVPSAVSRDMTIHIRWPGRGSVQVLDHCIPSRLSILNRALQLARTRLNEFGSGPSTAGGTAFPPLADTKDWETKMQATLKRVRAGGVTHEVTSPVNDLSPLLVAMGSVDKVGLPCFEVEVNTREPGLDW